MEPWAGRLIRHLSCRKKPPDDDVATLVRSRQADQRENAAMTMRER